MSSDTRCLVIDDDASARETLSVLLRIDEYTIECAASGQEALDCLAKSPAELILCDLMMPGMDGFEVCRRVKQHAEWRLIPIILVTALDGDEDMMRGIEAGADEFLRKPVEYATLRARVRAMLRVRAQYKQLEGRTADLPSLLKARREQIASSAGLSERERQVLDLLLLGRTHAEIGTVLSISERTARFHQANLLQKLGADSRTDLTRLFLI